MQPREKRVSFSSELTTIPTNLNKKKSPERSPAKMGRHGDSFSPSNDRAVVPHGLSKKEKARKERKEIEKHNPFGYVEPILVTCLGIGLIWNVEKMIKDKSEANHKMEKEKEEKEAQRRRRQQQRGGGGSSSSRDRGFQDSDDDDSDTSSSRDSRYSHGSYDRRDERRYDDRYDDRRGSRNGGRRGSRRDSF